jgi:CRP-like cAMP-binding protein
MADAALRSRVFDGLTDAERADWLKSATPSTLDRSQTLARQGEPARQFVVVQNGFLKLLQVTPDGEEIIVRFVGPGEPFGGVVVLGDVPYPVTAVVVQPTTVLAWSRPQLLDLLSKYPVVRTNIMREMTSHMTDALTRVRELSSAPVEQRLASTLLRLARQYGQKTDEGVLIAQPLTRQDLAELTGTTLYTVSRTLSKWKGVGLVSSRRRQLVLPSIARIEQAAANARTGS